MVFIHVRQPNLRDTSHVEFVDDMAIICVLFPHGKQTKLQ